jgi:hypothetical protein
MQIAWGWTNGVCGTDTYTPLLDTRPMHYGVIDIMGIEYSVVDIPSVFAFDVGHHHL